MNGTFKRVAAMLVMMSIVTLAKPVDAQTPVGVCTVSNAVGTALNVRATPGGRIISSVRKGTRVALGVTDGSQGRNWTRIISPVSGYVSSAYLKNCRYKY